MTASATVGHDRRPGRRRVMVGVGVAVLIAAAGLLWAKWLPYEARVRDLGATRTWSGSGILTVGGVQPGDPPSWSAATSFTWAYAQAVWKALLVALLISAAVQALVPRTWLLRVLNRPGRVSAALAGGLASTPSMMCACCAAPVAVGLRRSGVSTAAVLAYWLGNPLLNPAVLVFLALVAPWQWTATRLVVGAGLVVGGAALIARLTERRASTAVDLPPRTDPPPSVGRYLRCLARLGVTLVPEYLVVVMLIGGFRGWLFPLAGSALSAGLLTVLVAAVVGTALVIPTGGEIPITQGLALAGLSLGAVGALLVTLPAVSLAGVAMVGRAFGWRATTWTAGLVVVGGVVAGGVLILLSRW